MHADSQKCRVAVSKINGFIKNLNKYMVSFKFSSVFLFVELNPRRKEILLYYLYNPNKIKIGYHLIQLETVLGSQTLTVLIMYY